MVRKALEEVNNDKNSADRGTFQLHYTPADTDRKSFTIPLPNRFNHQYSTVGNTRSQTQTNMSSNDIPVIQSDIVKSRH